MFYQDEYRFVLTTAKRPLIHLYYLQAFDLLFCTCQLYFYVLFFHALFVWDEFINGKLVTWIFVQPGVSLCAFTMMEIGCHQDESCMDYLPDRWFRLFGIGDQKYIIKEYLSGNMFKGCYSWFIQIMLKYSRNIAFFALVIEFNAQYNGDNKDYIPWYLALTMFLWWVFNEIMVKIIVYRHYPKYSSQNHIIFILRGYFGEDISDLIWKQFVKGDVITVVELRANNTLS